VSSLAHAIIMASIPPYSDYRIDEERTDDQKLMI
jgi:hypothetical protein